MIHSAYLDNENKKVKKSIKNLKTKYIVVSIIKLIIMMLSIGISFALISMGYDIDFGTATIIILISSLIIAMALFATAIGLLSITISCNDQVKEMYGSSGATMMTIIAILDTLSSGLFALVLFFAVWFQFLSLLLTVAELVLLIILSFTKEHRDEYNTEFSSRY